MFTAPLPPAHDTKVFMECHARMCFEYAGLDQRYHLFLERMFEITDFVMRDSMTDQEVQCDLDRVQFDKVTLCRSCVLDTIFGSMSLN